MSRQPSTDLDLAAVIGTLSSDPATTELASGSVLVRYEVTARHAGGTDSVPVSWIDPPRPPAVRAGDRVAVVGHVRRRFFRAGRTTRSATEIAATWVGRARSTRRVAAVLGQALDALDT